VAITANLTFNHELHINVIDTGVGIPQDKLPTLFEAFSKISDNRDLNKGGCGLGLKISKNLT
jgi:signal transduction histidine kinase